VGGSAVCTCIILPDLSWGMIDSSGTYAPDKLDPEGG